MTSRTFSFGPAAQAGGFIAIDADTRFDPARGWGWLGTPKLHARDRGQPTPPRGTLVLGLGPATFRIVTAPGLYRLRFGFCDVHFQGHAIRIEVAGCVDDIPVIEPRSIEHVTLEIVARAQDGMLDIAFSSPGDNWIINWLELSPAPQAAAPEVTRERVYRDMWRLPPQTARGPLAQIARWRSLPAAQTNVVATGIGAGDYLGAIRASLRYFVARQDSRGAIIDADTGAEILYATPCFAHAAALVARHDGDAALAERAIRATSHAVQALATRSAASEHEDFFPAPLAHALRLLAGTAPAALQKTWRDALAGMDPYETYRNRVGGMDGAGSNWNCKALAGEALLHLAGIRADPSYAHRSLLEQGRFFNSEFGLYAEGPMTYDAFPRVWLADMLEAGYAGPGADMLRETLHRGALTSLLTQSPSGELPAGGRTGQHLWSDALQVPMFEIEAKRMAAAGETVLAGSFKRAAHRAFAALLRWQRPSGEFQVVKNRAEPAARHGYENYTSHSNYNLLLLSILAHGFEHAQATEGLEERITPAETGGFALELPGPFHKAFAAAGGAAVQICLRTEDRQTPAGLIRIAFDGIPGEMGPGDGLVGRPFFHLPQSPRADLSIGLAWTGPDEQVRSLASTGRREVETEVKVLAESPAEVRLGVEWRMPAEKLALTEEYTVLRDQVAIRYRGGEALREARLRWPVLAHDGTNATSIDAAGMRVAVVHEGATVEFVVEGTDPPQLGTELVAHRQGFVRIVEARLRPGQEPVLTVRALARPDALRRWRDRADVPRADRDDRASHTLSEPAPIPTVGKHRPNHAVTAEIKESAIMTAALMFPFSEIKKHVPNQELRIIFDVGANEGQSCIAYSRSLPEAEIHAFEPVFAVHQKLKVDLKNYANIRLNNVALGENEGSIPMLIAENSTMSRVAPKNTTSQTIEVDMTTISSYCHKNSISYINFLKIDTEGHDLSVIKGCGDFLRNIDFIQCEASANKYNTFHGSFFDIFDYMTSRNFYLFNISGQTFEWGGGGYPVLRRFDPLFINARVVGPLKRVVSS